MIILQIITRCELGGAQSVVVNLANKLSDENEVIVAAGEGDGKMFSLLNPRIKQERLHHLQRALSPKNDFLSIFDLWKLYQKYQPDIVHLHSSKAGMLGRLVFPSKKVVYTVHGFDSIRLAHRIFLPFEKFMQRACKAIVGVSKYDVENLLQNKIDRNVSCIYNGISKPIITNSLSFPILKSYNKTILCIARLASPKRYDLFMAVAELLPQYAFIWIGNQHEVLNHPENVYFLGNIPNAGTYCSIADLFMLPSDYEGLPMVILEAMSFGKPVVASNVGGISEIVVNDQNGYTVENDSRFFAEKIVKILEDDDVYKKFSNNAQQRFYRDLTVDEMVNSYLKIYKNKEI